MSATSSAPVIGVLSETFEGERRVGLVPAHAALLAKKGLEVVVESGAGEPAGFLDEAYREKGAEVLSSRQAVIDKADVLLQVRAAGAAGGTRTDYKAGQVLIAHCDPLSEPQAVSDLAGQGVTAFALELLPRITRAQSMDVLSSMATVAGYKAVLLAADRLPRMFPMLMTAAGTVKAARVLIMGAGVAGLQAIATAKRLGAVVSSYDIRPAVKEQVESLGAKFVELDLQTGDSETKGGYAKEMGEEFIRRQQELMTEVVAGSDVVITTAAIPGKKAPILVTAPMVEAMAPGSVIVDLAAERGGNCELTEAGIDVVKHGVTIVGPTNLPATVPYHASEMYSKNVTTFLLNLVADGQIAPDKSDEIVADTMLCEGEIVTNNRVRELLGLPVIEPPEPEPTPEPQPESATIPLYDGDDPPEEIRHQSPGGFAKRQDADEDSLSGEGESTPAVTERAPEQDAAEVSPATDVPAVPPVATSADVPEAEPLPPGEVAPKVIDEAAAAEPPLDAGASSAPYEESAPHQDAPSHQDSPPQEDSAPNDDSADDTTEEPSGPGA